MLLEFWVNLTSLCTQVMLEWGNLASLYTQVVLEWGNLASLYTQVVLEWGNLASLFTFWSKFEAFLHLVASSDYQNAPFQNYLDQNP